MKAQRTAKGVTFCDCADWELCGCGNQPPYHCMWCCKSLSPEQIEIAKIRADLKAPDAT